MADSFYFLDLNSVILLNFNEKNQVTSPEIFSGGGDVTSVKSCKLVFPFSGIKSAGVCVAVIRTRLMHEAVRFGKKDRVSILSNNYIKSKKLKK